MWAAELGIRVGRLGSRRETERLDEQQWGANPALRCSTNNATRKLALERGMEHQTFSVPSHNFCPYTQRFSAHFDEI